MKKIVVFASFMIVFCLQINSAKQKASEQEHSTVIEGLEDIFGKEGSLESLSEEDQRIAKPSQLTQALNANVSSEPEPKIKVLIAKLVNTIMGLVTACGDFFKSFNN